MSARATSKAKRAGGGGPGPRGGRRECTARSPAPTHPVDPKRSAIMAAVKSRDTTPERRVAAELRRLGVRFREHATDLPGTPDVVLDDAGVAIFVHGCWWHGHSCPRGSRVPKRNRAYWLAKVTRNRQRDRRVTRELRAMGYAVWTVWECELKRAGGLPRRVVTMLDRHGALGEGE